MALNTDQVLQALSTIIDPDLQRDIVSLGFVKDLRIDGGRVSFSIELTTPACPVKARFQRQAEQAVAALPGVTDVEVRMTAQDRRAAWSATVPDSALRDVGAVIAVSSCKGGVGKSTVAAHLAVEIAQRGYRVGLLDADLYGPSVPTLFGLGPTVNVQSNDRQQILPVERLGVALMSFGFLLKDSPAVMRGPMVSQYLTQLLHHTAWGRLDYLLVDMPPGTGDIQLTLTQAVPLDGAVIVTTRQALSLVDVARGILMFEKVKVPMLGLLENMSYLTCEHCQGANAVFGPSRSGTLQDRFGLDLLAEIPLMAALNGPLETYAPLEPFQQAADGLLRALGKQRHLREQVPSVAVDADQVVLTWPDGSARRLGFAELRAQCTCAHCVDEMTGERRLDPSTIAATIAPEEITPLGHYAFSVRWNDGHASSIYAYDRYREPLTTA